MNIDITDVLFHVPADLAAIERENIERDLQGCDGVISAHFAPGQPHMLEVAYNPEAVTRTTLTDHLTERGLKVTMTGL